MQADFSVELGTDDPTLAVPWSDLEGHFLYHDLREDPGAILEIPEAQAHPDLRRFLTTINSTVSSLQSVKCDTWYTEEISEEEQIFGAPCKFASYVDAIFHQQEQQSSFEAHETFAGRLVELLKRAPELQGYAELFIRRAHYEDAADDVREGMYFTLYVFGFGGDEQDARQSWGIALRLVGHAILQMSARKPG